MTVGQPGREHFDWASYVEKPRWASYWHQVDEALAITPRTCLVIGGGDGIVVDILRRRGVEVTTCDVVEDLGPDVVADVRDLPFADKAFDVSICCQVLEHIEYRTVPTALAQLARVTCDRTIISVPDQGRAIDIALSIGLGRKYFRRFSVPSRKGWSFNGVHYWELGTTPTPAAELRELLTKNFQLMNEYRVRENAYHRFFVLGPS
jgi:ubiquinone/menaquinone biosynthesis C-methylase UbiE